MSGRPARRRRRSWVVYMTRSAGGSLVGTDQSQLNQKRVSFDSPVRDQVQRRPSPVESRRTEGRLRTAQRGSDVSDCQLCTNTVGRCIVCR